MHPSKTQQTLVGLFVASGIAGLFFMAIQISNFNFFANDPSYTLIAHFSNSGGLKIKSAVTIAGVKVGKVASISVDSESYQSVVQMTIYAKYQIPDDTTANIYTAGLLGEQYISLEPGGSELILQDGGRIDLTQSAVILEEIIGQFLFKSASDEGS